MIQPSSIAPSFCLRHHNRLSLTTPFANPVTTRLGSNNVLSRRTVILARFSPNPTIPTRETMSTISECEQRLDEIAAQKALLERQLAVELEEKDLSILQWKLETERASRSTRNRKRQRSDSESGDDLLAHAEQRRPPTTRRKRAPSSLLNLLCGQGQERFFPVFERLAGFLDIGSIVALTRTCKRLSGVYQSLLPVQWDVNQRLARFVTSPERFRYTLGKSGGLISGSFALQFFERVVWRDADLDVFVEDGRGAAELVRYVEEEEGYGRAKHVALGGDLPHQYLRQVR